MINMDIKVKHSYPHKDDDGYEYTMFCGVGRIISFVSAGSVGSIGGSVSGYDEIYAMVLADNRIHCVRYNELEVVND